MSAWSAPFYTWVGSSGGWMSYPSATARRGEDERGCQGWLWFCPSSSSLSLTPDCPVPARPQSWPSSSAFSVCWPQQPWCPTLAHHSMYASMASHIPKLGTKWKEFTLHLEFFCKIRPQKNTWKQDNKGHNFATKWSIKQITHEVVVHWYFHWIIFYSSLGSHLWSNLCLNCTICL